MPPMLVLRYSPEDIAAALLASAPTEHASVFLHRSADPNRPELLAVMRLAGSDQDPELVSWVPYSWCARSGEHLILHFGHQTVLDIIATHARDLAARTCWGVGPAMACARADPASGDIVVEVIFHAWDAARTPPAAEQEQVPRA